MNKRSLVSRIKNEYLGKEYVIISGLMHRIFDKSVCGAGRGGN